jgi:hypothetical protein
VLAGVCTQPGEHHGPGVKEAPETGRSLQVRNVGTPSRSGGNDRLPVGAARNSGREQDGQEAKGGCRKVTGKQVHVAGPSEHGRACITGRIPVLVAGPERELT